jgi:hypothetical protein
MYVNMVYIYLYICTKLIPTLYVLLQPMGYVDRDYIIITVERCSIDAYILYFPHILFTFVQGIGLAVYLL